MFLATDGLTYAGGLAGIIGSLVAAWSLVQQRRTDSKSVSQATLDKALEAQEALLDRYEKRIEYLEDRENSIDIKLSAVKEELKVASQHAEQCDKRLAIAETRIAELGG